MILKDNAKRLGVFIFYDRDSIVDEYVEFLLKSLKEATNDIIIISNSLLSTDEKKKLEKFSNKIRIRNNIGLDAGAFKTAYDEFSDYFQKFDELLLVNDTFFGPFVPFKKICKDMAAKNIDFWGLTANYDSVDGFGNLPDNMIHSHIQTFFIAFRNNVLISDAFNKYWQKYNVNKMRNFMDVVTKHEIAFTHYLENNGFKWDIYTDLTKYKSDNIEENFNIYAYASYDLIKNYNCPFIKRKNFVFEKKDSLYLGDDSDSLKTLNYLQENKIYNASMIMKNITRIYNPVDIYYGLNMNYSVLESNKQHNYAIILNLKNDNNLDLYLKFLKNTDIKNIFVFTKSQRVINKLAKEKIEVLHQDSFDRNNFKYIGIVNDSFEDKKTIPFVSEVDFNNIIKNGLNNNNYINGICDTFDNNKYLGLLLLPPSYHNHYIGKLSDDKISYNKKCCFIKSNLFNEKILDAENYIEEFIKIIDINNLLLGKIYNNKEIMNIVSSQDYIIKKIMESMDEHGVNITSLNEMLHHLNSTKCYMPQTSKIKILIYKIRTKIRRIIKK